jgi:anhydro-N-acetylmuramic acid kinase
MNTIYTALGMMSGTSFDGIDLSIIETDGKDYLRLKKNFYYPYDPKIKKLLHNCKKKLSNKDSKAILKSSLFKESSREITMLHAKAAHSILRTYKKKVHLVGFHGVTIDHNPSKKKTIQLGDPLLLKQMINLPIVFNFRQNDLKNGGQGAPLIPVYHRALAKKIKEKKPTLFINIGGISNFTYINKNKMFASDIGPGNCLLDEWINSNTSMPYDKNGKMSSKGIVDFNFINNFIDRLEHFEKRNVSYDTSDFSISELRGLSVEDGAATLSYLAAQLIADLINSYPKVNNVYFGGGGRKNSFLMKVIKKLSKTNIVNLDKIDISGDFVESQAFAYLAVRSLLKLPITFKDTTGSKKPVSGGVIYR